GRAGGSPAVRDNTLDRSGATMPTGCRASSGRAARAPRVPKIAAGCVSRRQSSLRLRGLCGESKRDTRGRYRDLPSPRPDGTGNPYSTPREESIVKAYRVGVSKIWLAALLAMAPVAATVALADDAANQKIIEYYRRKQNVPPEVEITITDVTESKIPGMKM